VGEEDLEGDWFTHREVKTTKERRKTKRSLLISVTIFS